ncbi:hypothetical protein JG687_00014072 [Phytophthora cactorum]|uniref:Uncharacterized protein n=1 Tax=Phytophthora cactorum TaxID=29920 RepID=A0A8T1TZQ0_9STRA|nr:hypothetical protein JG687_00014072 [Phytophthora cactorum]
MDTYIPKYRIDWTTTSLIRLFSFSAMLENRVPRMKFSIVYQPTRVTALLCQVIRVPPILSAKKKQLKSAGSQLYQASLPLLEYRFGQKDMTDTNS